MAWEHLDIDEPHLAYMILGGFTSLFMLVSLFVKEKLYIGEATVATICGLIFGRHAADLFDPISWGNVDKITLECSRIVLVVQCFAVGVELPKAYMERHWKSVTILLLPVMTYGWLITSLFIWWMVPPLTWLESLACAACVTATDPVLASSVVGKSKFAKRVPKHLRDLLSAESGCNDGMAFPFIYLSLYILQYQPDSNKVALHWICVTILYECVVGAIVGFLIGYAGRHAIKFAHGRGLIDRESFLVFYFVLALFAAGTGSLLGMDDLLMGFSAGVGFSNDGWFTEKTEESHVSNVIDLLLNLAYFVYLGAIIPWEQFNSPDHGLAVWRLIVIAVLVLFFRRIPVMLALKPFIPDVKTWREALFAGHFGPIGVGAIFAAILTRAHLETETTQPLDELPASGTHNYAVINLIWPITTFLVISSILVHGSSVAVFTLGKRINTLTITMSYTQGNEEGPSWMNRLPRIASQSKGSLSLRKDSFDSFAEGLPQVPPGTLGPVGLPGNFLRRQREGDDSAPNSRASSRRPTRRRRVGAGGPISESAIMPQRRFEQEEKTETSNGGQAEQQSDEGAEMPASEEKKREAGDEREPELEIYQVGKNMIIEDEEGNVLDTVDMSHLSQEQQREEIMKQHRRLQEDRSGALAKSPSHPHEKTEGEAVKKAVEQKAQHPWANFMGWKGLGKHKHDEEPEQAKEKQKKEHVRRSARAYQFANTIIVEDEDGEVIKKYTIPAAAKPAKKEAHTEGEPSTKAEHPSVRQRLTRMGTWMGGKEGEAGSSEKQRHDDDAESDEEKLRFTIGTGTQLGGRRMTKEDFIKEIQHLEPKARKEIYDEGIPSKLKPVPGPEEVQSPQEQRRGRRQEASQTPPSATGFPFPSTEAESAEKTDIPTHDVAATLAQYSGNEISAAEARRRRLTGGTSTRSRRDSDDDGTRRIPPAELRQMAGISTQQPPSSSRKENVAPDTDETPAERKRRLAALGRSDDADADDEEDDEEGEEGGVRGRLHGRIQSRRDSTDSEDDGQPRAVKGKVQFADGTMPARRKDETLGVTSPGASSRPSGSDLLGVGEAGGDRSRSVSRTGSPSGNGNGNGRRGHASRISWGGERGRE